MHVILYGVPTVEVDKLTKLNHVGPDGNSVVTFKIKITKQPQQTRFDYLQIHISTIIHIIKSS